MTAVGTVGIAVGIFVAVDKGGTNVSVGNTSVAAGELVEACVGVVGGWQAASENMMTLANQCDMRMDFILIPQKDRFPLCARRSPD